MNRYFLREEVEVDGTARTVDRGNYGRLPDARRAGRRLAAPGRTVWIDGIAYAGYGLSSLFLQEPITPPAVPLAEGPAAKPADSRTRCAHWPAGAEGRSYGPVPGLLQWVNGERSTCVHCGDEIRYVEGYDLRRDYWATVVRADRRGRVAGCRTCALNAGPSHDASPRCESGKRDHCSCDVCF